MDLRCEFKNLHLIPFKKISNMYAKDYKGEVAFRINMQKLLGIIDNEDMQKYQQKIIIGAVIII
ncbi:MAG: hypothetical protein RR309_12205 [Cellulosilyticaceae bacterium]